MVFSDTRIRVVFGETTGQRLQNNRVRNAGTKASEQPGPQHQNRGSRTTGFVTPGPRLQNNRVRNTGTAAPEQLGS